MVHCRESLESSIIPVESTRGRRGGCLGALAEIAHIAGGGNRTCMADVPRHVREVDAFESVQRRDNGSTTGVSRDSFGVDARC
jgi:hypothetical protein